MFFKGYLLFSLDLVFLRQFVKQGGEVDCFLRHLQARLLQFGDGQNLFGQGQQVGAFFVQNGEILFLQFGVLVQQAAFQRVSGHGNSGDGRFHVMYHGIREVLPQAGYLVLSDNNPYLIDDTSGHEYQQQGCGHQQDTHLSESNPIRI